MNVQSAFDSLIEALQWSDASSAWVMLGVSFLFHLYSRTISEIQKYDRVIAAFFCVLYFVAITVAVTHNSVDVVVSPLLPTLIFSLVWFMQFIAVVIRFRERLCPSCKRRMAVSVPDAISLKLSQVTNVATHDVWFCEACLRAHARLKRERRCKICDVGTVELKGVGIISPPNDTSYGSIHLRSECECCHTRYSQRSLVAPTGFAENRIEREKRALKHLDRMRFFL